MTPAQRIREQIDLPTGVAVWVFAAHVAALASPLALSWQAHRHARALESLQIEPFLLHVAAALFLLGSAFEIAQNTADLWYYTGPYPAFCDLLFNTFIAFGLGALGLAAGMQGWLIAIVALAAVAFPVLYLGGRTPYPATGVLAMVAVASLYARLDDPVIGLLVVFTAGLNLYFLTLVVRTHAQSMHGAIALTNGLGLLAVPWAIERAVSGAPASWALLVIPTLAIGAAAALAWPHLARLRATQRSRDALGVPAAR